MDFPVYMKYVGPNSDAKGIIMRFDSLESGEVVENNFGANYGVYGVGYYSYHWLRCDSIIHWKEIDNPNRVKVSLPDFLFEVE